MISLVKRSIQIIEGNDLKRFIRRSARFATSSMKKSFRFPYIYCQDLKNKMKYGVDAPIYAERIWVNPSSVKMVITVGPGKYFSGQVIDTWPPNDRQPVPIMDTVKIKGSISHFVDGVAWEDTGIYKHLESRIAEGKDADGCKNRDDIIDRYKQMDVMFDHIREEHRIRTRDEVNPRNFRESGGICIHIGPGGELFFGYRGCHRFSIALALGLSTVPAQIGYVHKSAIPFLPALRQKDHTEC